MMNPFAVDQACAELLEKRLKKFYDSPSRRTVYHEKENRRQLSRADQDNSIVGAYLPQNPIQIGIRFCCHDGNNGRKLILTSSFCLLMVQSI